MANLKIPDKELVQKFKDKANGAVEIRKALEPAWKRNLVFFHNRLDYKWDYKARTFKVVRKTRDFIPVNLMVKIYQSRVARLLSIPTTFSTTPGSNQKGDETSAKYGEKLARAIISPQLQDKAEESLFWSLWVNRPLWKVRWDRDLGDYRHKPLYVNEPINQNGEKNRVIFQKNKNDEFIRGANGLPLQALNEAGLPIYHSVKNGMEQYDSSYDGDVRLSVISPFEYIIDPLARGDWVFDPKSENKARWVRQNKIVDKEYLIAQYGKESVEDITFTRRVAISGVEEEIWRLKGIPTEIESTETVELFEHWEMPSDKYPDGLVLTYLDTGKILQKERLPDPWLKLGRLPFIDTPAEINVPYRYYGETIMEKVAPLQRDFSQLVSQMAELRNKIGRTDVLLTGAGTLKRTEGEYPHFDNVYTFPGSAQQPQVVEYKTFPMTLIREIDRVLMNIEMVSGSTEMKYPLKEKTATEILQTLEQDETRLSIFKNKILGKVYPTIAKLGLEVIRTNYYPSRKIQVTGDYGMVETIEFDKAQLQGNYDFYIQASPLYLGNFIGQVQMVKDFIALGILQPERDKQTIMNMLNMRVNISSTEEQLDEKRANRENLMAKQKQPVPEPLEIDNDNIHLVSHRSFIKSEEESADSLTFERLRGHIKLHEIQMQTKIQTLMAMQQMAQPQTNLGEGESNALSKSGTT